MRARFDDLSPGAAHAFELVEPVTHLEAMDVGDVVPLLTEVQARVGRGEWAAGYVAYEAAPAFDSALAVRDPDPASPFAGLPPAGFTLFRSRRPTAPIDAGEGPGYAVSGWSASIDRAAYEEGIAAIHNHIAEGDTYQVNFTFRLRAALSGRPEGLYRHMALAQGGAYNAFLDTGRYAVISASPELFFRMDGRRIATRPMKGTSRRGRWSAEDAAAAEWLASSEKDRAENLMIVDLVRNDLGRVCRYGSVQVEDLFEVERFETVWQMSSTVVGELREGAQVADVLEALFPCGSVTGAPKQRTMEIIAELETAPRGVYCGAVGYLAPPGAGHPDVVFNVAIRTAVYDREEGVAEYGVGGGITWGSTASGEYDECRAKALVLAERRPAFSLIETLRLDERGLWWPERHLRRMSESAAYFGFSFDEAAARKVLDDVAADRPSMVRLVCDRQGRFRAEPGPLPAEPGEAVRLAIDAEPVNSNDPFLFHKTTNRRHYDRRLARHPGCDDVLLVNERGEVTESTIANLVVRLDGRWWTPPLESGCLPGIHRELLIEEGEIAERPIRPVDLGRAEEIALVNSVRLWRPARLIGPEGAAGPAAAERVARD